MVLLIVAAFFVDLSRQLSDDGWLERSQRERLDSDPNLCYSWFIFVHCSHLCCKYLTPVWSNLATVWRLDKVSVHSVLPSLIMRATHPSTIHRLWWGVHCILNTPLKTTLQKPSTYRLVPPSDVFSLGNLLVSFTLVPQMKLKYIFLSLRFTFSFSSVAVY